MNFEQFFDDVISGHNDIIGCWFFTASKVLGWSLIILKNWGHSTYQYYVTFSESDPSFRFSQMKKSWKMNLFDRSNPCFRVSRYRWIRWWYQIFDILNIGTFRFLKLKGPIIIWHNLWNIKRLFSPKSWNPSDEEPWVEIDFRKFVVLKAIQEWLF